MKKRYVLALVITLMLSACIGATGTTSFGELSSDGYRSARQDLLVAMEQGSAKNALTILREKASVSNAYARSCHMLSHEVGREAFKKYGTFGKAMGYQDEICNSGYLHGIIESGFLQSADIKKTIRDVCADYTSGTYLAWECYHGVGHGAMYYTGNDLPESLRLCETYTDGFARGSCVNGVYMENFNTDEVLHPSRFLDPSDPLLPCPFEPQHYKADCYLYAPVYYLTLHKNDYAGALAWCDLAEVNFRLSCVQGVGAQTMKENILDPHFTERICMSGGEEKKNSCISGMVGLFINHHGALRPALDMCATLQEENRQMCEGIVAANRPLFGR